MDKDNIITEPYFWKKQTKKHIVELVLFHMIVCTETDLKSSVEVCNELQEISFPQLFQSRNIVKLY